jgi:hypothetical protein
MSVSDGDSNFHGRDRGVPRESKESPREIAGRRLDLVYSYQPRPSRTPKPFVVDWGSEVR